jgi:hypothetical protein
MHFVRIVFDDKVNFNHFFSICNISYPFDLRYLTMSIKFSMIKTLVGF